MVQLQSIDNSIHQQTAKRPVATGCNWSFTVAEFQWIPITGLRVFAGMQITGPAATNTAPWRCDTTRRRSNTAPSRHDTDATPQQHGALALRHNTALSRHDSDAAPQQHGVLALRLRRGTVTLRQRHGAVALEIDSI
ncbi:hypothetical protein EDB85DRAFT_1884791 [Lactarius pseudohatsudake]|nr:hypothetical protein EDB85DRAFT_1884791 [Lactarius pseudohatsudake]